MGTQKFKLEELITIDLLQEIQESIAISSDISIRIAAWDSDSCNLKWMTKPSNTLSLCKLMMKSTEGRKKCIENHKEIAEKVSKSGWAMCGFCAGELRGCIVPISLGGKMIGVIMGSLGISRGISRESISENLNKDFGIDRKEADNAVKKIPVATDRDTEDVLYLLSSIVNNVVQIRYQRNLLKGEESLAELSEVEVLSAVTDLKVLLNIVVRRVARLTKAKGASLFLFDEERKNLVLRATTTLPEHEINHTFYKPKEGLTGWIGRYGKPLLINNVTDKEELKKIHPELRWSKRYKDIVNPDWKYAPFLGVPLRAKGRVIGVLRMTRKDTDVPFGEKDMLLATAFGSIVETAIENARIYKDREKMIKTLSKSIEFGNKISSKLDIEKLLKDIVKDAAKDLDAKICLLYLFTPDESRLILRAGHRIPKDMMGEEWKRGEGIIGDIAKGLKPIRRRDIRSYPKITTMGDKGAIWKQTKTFLGAPLRAGGRILGVLVLLDKRHEEGILPWFTTNDMNFLKFLSTEIAIAIENAKLYDIAKRAQEWEIEQKKMSALGRQAGEIAHSIKNPFTSIRSTAQNLKDITENKEVIEGLDGIIKNVDWGADRVSSILSFSKPSKKEKEEVNINELIDKILGLMATRNINITKRYETRLPKIKVAKSDIEAVIMNLIQNALEAMKDSKERILDIETTFSRDGSEIKIGIRDTGCGIPEKDKDRIFEPWFTTKTKGTGIGLSPSFNIIQEHGGRMNFRGLDKGTIFFIHLPLDETSKGVDALRLHVRNLIELYQSEELVVPKTSREKEIERIFRGGVHLSKKAIADVFKKTEQKVKKALEETKAIFIAKGEARIVKRDMVLGKDYIVKNHPEIIDEIIKRTGIASATVFQRTRGQAIRIATNIKRQDGSTAVSTFASKPIYRKTIEEGKRFIGRALLPDGWYLSAYEPIRDGNDKVIGMLYVGIPEGDPSIIDGLKEELEKIKIGKKGFVFILNKEAKVLISPELSQGFDLSQYEFCRKMLNREEGWVEYKWRNLKEDDWYQRLLYYSRYPEWDWVVCATGYVEEFLKVNTEVV